MRVITLLLTAILVLVPVSVALAQSSPVPDALAGLAQVEPAADSIFAVCYKLLAKVVEQYTLIARQAAAVYERSAHLLDYREYVDTRSAVNLFWASLLEMHMRSCKAPPLTLAHNLSELHSSAALYTHVRAEMSVSGSNRDKALDDESYLGDYMDGLVAVLKADQAQLNVVITYYKNNVPHREIGEVHGDPNNPCDVTQGQVHFWSRAGDNAEVMEWYELAMEQGCDVDGWYVPPTLDCAVLDERVNSSVMTGQGAAAANWRTVRMGAGC